MYEDSVRNSKKLILEKYFLEYDKIDEYINALALLQCKHEGIIYHSWLEVENYYKTIMIQCINFVRSGVLSEEKLLEVLSEVSDKYTGQPLWMLLSPDLNLDIQKNIEYRKCIETSQEKPSPVAWCTECEKRGVKQHRVFQKVVQIARIDEPPTIVSRCDICGNRWSSRN